MSKFQLVLIGLFVVFLFIGVVVFSAYRGSSQNAITVTVWGTVSNTDFNSVIAKTPLYQSKEYKIQYVQKTEGNFDTDFIEALASGNGPDVFMLSSDKILKHRNKIFPIPYNVLTKRQFMDSFIEGAEIYMAPEGTLGLPISVDPLVMYWNRSIFTDVRITEPPKYWDEFYNLVAKITKKDGTLNILRSAVALGGYANIAHAKEIIMNLAMQAGTPVTIWSGEKVQSVFSSSFNTPITPAEAAVSFFAEFGNPSKPSYSWNTSLPNSTIYFLGDDLALYFGFGSEAGILQIKNPNLNFDIAPVPTSREGGGSSYAKFNALAITKSSGSKSAAFAVISVLSGAPAAQVWTETLDLPPARRDLLSKKQTDAFKAVFYDSAIRGKAWLDPGPAESDAIFRRMIESILSGRARIGEAINKAQDELTSLLNKK